MKILLFLIAVGLMVFPGCLYSAAGAPDENLWIGNTDYPYEGIIAESFYTQADNGTWYRLASDNISPGAVELDDLVDVDLSGESDGDLLTYDAGISAFINSPPVDVVSDSTYGSGWDSDADNAPSKNAVYDKINGMLKVKSMSITRDLTLGSGDVAYTDVGFTPFSIIASGAATGTACIAQSDPNRVCRGLMMSPVGAQPMGSLIYLTTSSGNHHYAIIKSYDSDGFTLTWTKTGSPTGTATIVLIIFG